jgi:hypothetical protein
MYVFVVLWNAKPKWLALSPDERAAFIEQVTTKMNTVVEDGFGALCWAENNAETAHRAKYDYLGLWKMSNESMVRQFEDAIAATGWYDYFDQVNLGGRWSAPEDVLRKMIFL